MAKRSRNVKTESQEIARLLADGRAIDAAMKRAAKEAVRQHQLAGNPIALGRNGKVIWVRLPRISPAR